MQDPISWRMYNETKSRHDKGDVHAPEYGAYLPSPADIENRIKMMEELRGYGFNEDFIGSIMIHDSPTITRVRQMLKRYPPEQVWNRCKHFIIKIK